MTVGRPVFSKFTTEHQFGQNGYFSTVVRVCPGLRRIDFHTRILNSDEFVRYRVLFPTSVIHGQRLDEVPFGAVKRPESIEFPAQN